MIQNKGGAATRIGSKEVLKYAALPRIMPRSRDLFQTGFAYIPFFIAIVYQAVQLLPSNHPFANSSNIGKFSIRDVVAVAANNLVISRNNIDQIIIFAVVLIGLGILLAQILLLALSLFSGVAYALPADWGDFFTAPNAYHDYAFMFLDAVFGVPAPNGGVNTSFFGSCVGTGGGGAPCANAHGLPSPGTGLGGMAFDFPSPFHNGLHALFQYYSFGLLIVAVIITTYFVITVVAETAQTGTPFGKRFNKVWAPLRLVVAFGLLIPIGIGLNSSQYIVLYAAKWGSNFASNGWVLFNTTLTGHYLDQTLDLVAQPNTPEIGSLLQFFYAARGCYWAEFYRNGIEVQPYLVKNPLDAPNNLLVGAGTSYAQAMDFAGGSSQIILRFGERSAANYGTYKGFVYPTCGEISMTLSSTEQSGIFALFGGMSGTDMMQQEYWQTLVQLWYDYGGPVAGGNDYPQNLVRNRTLWGAAVPGAPAIPSPEPSQDFKIAMKNFYEAQLDGAIAVAVLLQIASNRFDVALGDWNPFAVSQMDRGWAGAGMWYNQIAEMNGALTSAVFGIPVPKLYPAVMEEVRKKKLQNDQSVPGRDRYTPTLANGQDVRFAMPQHAQMARVYNELFQFWEQDGHSTTSHTDPTQNVVIDTINAIFGTEGLFDMRANADVHPLAQLSAVGRGLVESSIRNLGYAAAGGAAGALGSILDPFIGAMGGTAASFLVTFGIIGLTMGFVLFYVVPFLPFIYFFFAVGGWVKGIFEAMVGAPLWALAHLRIDGNGLPGQAAVAGYFLIFEIFLRPILIIFGLLASISIFSAMVQTLNEIFDLVVNNLSGYDAVDAVGPDQIEFYRAPIDEFFFTVIYVIIVYLMGMSSFKLIDLIPNNILRWMGQSVNTFNDSREDPAQGLVSTSYIGSQQTIGQIGNSLGGSIGRVTNAG